eukprot:GHVS01080943.1.p1 GENE.GHVS01080943.1~~GHVS01080943.1.p1  ORF type:complete len:101 (+),score=5.98 GHVS01080943.1:414-716(+)
MLCLETSTTFFPHIQHRPCLWAQATQYLPWFIKEMRQTAQREPHEAVLERTFLSSNLLTPTARPAPFLTSGVISLESFFSHLSQGITAAHRMRRPHFVDT